MLVTTTNASTLLIQNGDDSVEATPEEAHALALRLIGAVQSLHYPALEIDGQETVCPHCGRRTPVDSDVAAVVEHDYDARANDGFLGFTDPSTVAIGQNEQNYSTVAYACYGCDRFVDLPSGTFDISWS